MMPAKTRLGASPFRKPTDMALTRARGGDFQSSLCATFDSALMSARWRPD